MCITMSAVFSQGEAVDAQTRGGDNLTYIGVVTDTIGKTDSTLGKVFRVITPKLVTPYIFVSLDSLRGVAADTVTVFIRNKMFDGQSFVDVDTLYWVNDASADVIFNPGTTYTEEFWQIWLEGESDEYAVSLYAIYANFRYSE